jgi:hypothetical protein
VEVDRFRCAFEGQCTLPVRRPTGSRLKFAAISPGAALGGVESGHAFRFRQYTVCVLAEARQRQSAQHPRRTVCRRGALLPAFANREVAQIPTAFWAGSPGSVEDSAAGPVAPSGGRGPHTKHPRGAGLKPDFAISAVSDWPRTRDPWFCRSGPRSGPVWRPRRRSGSVRGPARIGAMAPAICL